MWFAAPLRQMKALTSLSVTRALLSDDAGAVLVAALAELSRLTHLDLRNNRCRSATVFALSSFIRGKQCALMRLSFTDNAARADELLVLAGAILDNPFIKYADLSWNSDKFSAVMNRDDRFAELRVKRPDLEFRA
jgi:hypothetical protein